MQARHREYVGSKTNSRFARTPDKHFHFVPDALAIKCRRLIEAYHAKNGYAGLPDTLWQPKLRDFIEMHRVLQRAFKRAAAERSAKKANQGFVSIATTMLALEVLASDFAGWSTLFPRAKDRAVTMLDEYTLSSRAWLVDIYVYQDGLINPAVVDALSPGEGVERRTPSPKS
jgi:hypothetical protein